jgi:hypothetical protein
VLTSARQRRPPSLRRASSRRTHEHDGVDLGADPSAPRVRGAAARLKKGVAAGAVVELVPPQYGCFAGTISAVW